MAEVQTIQQKPTFTTIQFVTKDGEKCTATKNNGIVTVQGDKNGVRQVPVEQFMKELVATLPKNVDLTRTPAKDTVQFSGNEETVESEAAATTGESVEETNKKLNKKYLGIAAVALAVVGTGIYILGRGKWWSKAAKEVEQEGQRLADDATEKLKNKTNNKKSKTDTHLTNQEASELVEDTTLGVLMAADDLSNTAGRAIDTEGIIGGTDAGLRQKFADFIEELTGKTNPTMEELGNALSDLSDTTVSEGAGEGIGSILEHLSEILGQ